MSIESRQRLFRIREEGEGGARVTEIELFFDLIFVFAVTQLSHNLLEHLSLAGALETFVLFLAVWWLWIFTSWATNWLDPDRGAVRAMLVGMMLGALVLSSALPKAFDKSGLVFASAYVAMQLLRTLWIAWLSSGHNAARMRNFLRIAFYFALSAPFWIAGALVDDTARLVLWATALAIEYAAPFLFFATPGIGGSKSTDWDISGSHMSERCALFIIIALGETILVTGATFGGLNPDLPTVAAFATSFVGTVTMWWVYFDTGAKRGGEAIEHAGDTGKLARDAYTYLHMPIVAGIIVTAVADEMMLAHPVGHHAELTFILAACGGPALFLLGNLAFKYTTAERPIPPLSHAIGLALLVGTGISAWQGHWTPLATGIAATGALLVTALWEWFSLHGGWHRWLPWLDRRTKIALEDSER